MNMNSQTIHIEGLDLAGKSTICRNIVKLGNFEKRNNSILSEGLNPIHKVAEVFRKEKTLGNADLGWLFYGALLLDLKDYIPSETPIVQDSTLLLRSIAYHSVFGDKELAKKFRELIPQHPRFAFSCLLTASLDVRLERLRGRISRGNDRPEDYLIRENSKGFKEMEDILIELVKNEFNGIVIDSSNLEAEGEKERIATLIIQNANVK